jgi:hypothetical protein
MRDVVHGFANTLSVAPPTFPLRRDDVDYVDAEVFRQRFRKRLCLNCRDRADIAAILRRAPAALLA